MGIIGMPGSTDPDVRDGSPADPFGDIDDDADVPEGGQGDLDRAE